MPVFRIFRYELCDKKIGNKSGDLQLPFRLLNNDFGCHSDGHFCQRSETAFRIAVRIAVLSHVFAYSRRAPHARLARRDGTHRAPLRGVLFISFVCFCMSNFSGCTCITQFSAVPFLGQSATSFGARSEGVFASDFHAAHAAAQANRSGQLIRLISSVYLPCAVIVTDDWSATIRRASVCRSSR